MILRKKYSERNVTNVCAIARAEISLPGMIRALAFFALFAIAPLAHAQDVIGLERSLDLTLSPEYPAPGDIVSLSIQTFALDLNRSEIIWYANDKEIARGAGLVETTVPAGAGGTETVIRVVAEDEEGLLGSASATIRPSEVDLLWEASSYAPPFYKGRILPGSDSPVRFQALARFRTASGTLLPESSIVYTWYRNDAIAVSGRGKSAVTLPGPGLFGTDTIRVSATSADGSFNGAASTRVASTDPFAVLYENHPLFGILYHRSLESGANTLETEQKVTAVPYFSNILSPMDPALLYEWDVNGERIQPNPQEPQTLTIAAGGYQGPVDIELSVSSLRDFAMHATGKWQLMFGANGALFSGFNPFGASE